MSTTYREAAPALLGVGTPLAPDLPVFLPPDFTAAESERGKLYQHLTSSRIS